MVPSNWQADQLNRVIVVNKRHNWKQELGKFLLSYRKTPHCKTGEMPSFLLFSRVIRNKLSTILNTAIGSRHDDVVKCNHEQEGKIKTYADAKRRAKTNLLKAGGKILVKHTGTKDKLTSYWPNDLFTAAHVSGLAIIIKWKRGRKVFARSISMVEKYQHISDADYHSGIDSSSSEEIN